MPLLLRPMARVPFDPGTDYYQLLGVSPGAPPEEIQAAYRRLAKEFHPDLNAGSALAAARMARVNIAKSVLLDRETRATYDHLRAVRRHAAPRRGGVSTTPWPAEPAPTVRYAPHQANARPRHRIVSSKVRGGPARGSFDRQTGILLLVAVPLIAVLVLYVFQAFQLSIQPLKAAPADTNLAQGPVVRPTTRSAAETVFMMVHGQPPSRELATRAFNFLQARYDSSPEGEALRTDSLRLLRAANSGDTEMWAATVADLCRLAGETSC